VVITKNSPFTKKEITELETDKLNLLSLSMDLKRICSGIQRKSYGMADEFSQQAKRWLKIKANTYHTQEILKEVKQILDKPNSLQKAEDCLMYSVLLQNRAIKM
jgi:hypothetical protein